MYLLGDLEKRLAGVEAHFSELDDDKTDFTPFITKVAGTLFSNTLMEEFALLTQDQIGPTVEFYHQIRTLNQMADDMRSERYTCLTHKRKKALLRDMLKMDNRAMLSAKAALRVLDDALNIPSDQRISHLEAKYANDRA